MKIKNQIVIGASFYCAFAGMGMLHSTFAIAGAACSSLGGIKYNRYTPLNYDDGRKGDMHLFTVLVWDAIKTDNEKELESVLQDFSQFDINEIYLPVRFDRGKKRWVDSEIHSEESVNRAHRLPLLVVAIQANASQCVEKLLSLGAQCKGEYYQYIRGRYATKSYDDLIYFASPKVQKVLRRHLAKKASYLSVFDHAGSLLAAMKSDNDTQLENILREMSNFNLNLMRLPIKQGLTGNEVQDAVIDPEEIVNGKTGAPLLAIAIWAKAPRCVQKLILLGANYSGQYQSFYRGKVTTNTFQNLAKSSTFEIQNILEFSTGAKVDY